MGEPVAGTGSWSGSRRGPFTLLGARAGRRVLAASAGPPGGAAHGFGGEGGLRYVVAFEKGGAEGLEDGGGRQGEGGAGDDRPEGDGGVELHGVGGDAWGEQVVLHLLVDDDEPKREGTVDRVVEQGDEHGHG